MSDIIESTERLIGRLYTAFVLRDLTFFISGAIVIVFWIDSPLEHLADILEVVPRFYWFVIVAFLALSYVLGIVLQELVRTFLEPLSRCYIRSRLKKPELNTELVARMDRLIKKGCSEHTIRGLERILYLKQIGSTQFSALLMILLSYIFQVRSSGITAPVLIILIVGLLLCKWIYLDKSLQQEKILRSLEG